jgi:hypothetical protein
MRMFNLLATNSRINLLKSALICVNLREKFLELFKINFEYSTIIKK